MSPAGRLNAPVGEIKAALRDSFVVYRRDRALFALAQFAGEIILSNATCATGAMAYAFLGNMYMRIHAALADPVSLARYQKLWSENRGGGADG